MVGSVPPPTLPLELPVLDPLLARLRAAEVDAPIEAPEKRDVLLLAVEPPLDVLREDPLGPGDPLELVSPGPPDEPPPLLPPDDVLASLLPLDPDVPCCAAG